MGPKDLAATPCTWDEEIPPYTQKNQFAVSREIVRHMATAAWTTQTYGALGGPCDPDKD